MTGVQFEHMAYVELQSPRNKEISARSWPPLRRSAEPRWLGLDTCRRGGGVGGSSKDQILHESMVAPGAPQPRECRCGTEGGKGAHV